MNVAFLLVVFVVALGLGFLGIFFRVLAIAMGVALGIPLVAAFIALVLVGVLAANVSYLGIIVERSGFITAFSTAIARVFGRALRRSLLVSLALAAVGVGIYLMGALGQGFLFGILHNNALGTAFSAVLRLIVVLFTSVFVAIYYYDIRVRTEGLDLQLAAASQETGVAPVLQ